MIIYSGSCTNIASNIVVEKFNLDIITYERLYQLKLLTNSGIVMVYRQDVILFLVGRC